MINDDSKEKSKILDRLYKAEHKNIEFEQTIKTLNRRIATMENQHSNHTSQDSNCNTERISNTKHTDELIIGVCDKVTKYVLNKNDKELDIHVLLTKDCSMTSNQNESP